MHLHLIDPIVARVVALAITIAITRSWLLLDSGQMTSGVFESFRLAIPHGNDIHIISSPTRSLLLPLQIFMINNINVMLEYI